MSIEIVLIPLAVAAVSAWKASRTVGDDGRSQVVVSTRMKSAELLALALQDLDAEVQTSPEGVSGRWAGLEARFDRDAAGVWTAHFVGETTTEAATAVIRDLDAAYGLRVQEAVLERVRSRAPDAGMAIESETMEDDRTVTLVLALGRAT